MHRPVIVPTAVLLFLLIAARAPRPHEHVLSSDITFNDNRTPAGTLTSGRLDLNLEAAEGTWHPYGPSGPALPLRTFGETGKQLQTPGPLVRVKEGTRIHVRVHNALAKPLVIHGFSARQRPAMDTLLVPPNATRDVTFSADVAGTYYYWGTTSRGSFGDRGIEDFFLNGALVVDARGAGPRPDRVFVVQWHMPKFPGDMAPDFANGFFTFNGRPWPYTERLTYSQGDSIHWRVINATADVHPLHLHGFYFRVTARGDEQRDTLYWQAQERMGVTELMTDGTTMDLAWKADRPGAWIFHCHLNFHVLPNTPQGADMKPDSVIFREMLSAPSSHDMLHMNHAEQGMGGLILGINIKPSAEWKRYSGPRERLRLYIQTDSAPNDTLRTFGYALARDGEAVPATALKWPGPPIVLHKGKPTSIWVINHALEPSQVHWHGLELDSYFDGVAGLSSNAGMVSPAIMPNDSFEVTVTPPRAGSFMYHTHVNDIRQQSRGLYGPIIVLDSTETWDPEHNLIFQVSTDPQDDPILNGSKSPPALTVHTKTRYRLRLMNVTLDAPFHEFWLTGGRGGFVTWTAVAKDGFDLPRWQRLTTNAKQRVSIGETYDFTVTFPDTGMYGMESHAGSGVLFTKQAIHVIK